MINKKEKQKKIKLEKQANENEAVNHLDDSKNWI